MTMDTIRGRRGGMRWLGMALVHGALITLSYGLAFLLRFEFDPPPQYARLFLPTLPILLLTRLAVFARFHLFTAVWWYVSVRDLVAILKAVALSSALFVAGVLAIVGHGFPRSVFVLDTILCLMLVGGVRLALRAYREAGRQVQDAGTRRVLIVGAGDAGETLLREIGRNQSMNYAVVGFVDDDRRKAGRRIHGLEVLGSTRELPQLCRSRDIQEVLIAIPSATWEERRRILHLCRESGLPFKSVPALTDLLQGKAGIAQLQEVRPEDLLGREEVRLDAERIRGELSGRRVLVTGAAGSIGSELSRQIAAFEPRTLILLDRAESGLYFVDLDLRREYPSVEVVPVIGDIQDSGQVEEIIRSRAPDLVFHAAAYKHVPLMEEHPLEGITNNVFGTEMLVSAANRAGVKKFVLISTDKAVRPVSVMGMTKRLAESLLLAWTEGPTTFVAVRFGNVLGSDGSVFPLFSRQMARGGPITVTDPEASRYFMLLSEAAQLVLQASAIGTGGEIFFLDMGEPVKILDLAHNLVRLSGLEPEKDIPIEVIGLRPGERLREELVTDTEDLLPTNHEKISMIRRRSFDPTRFLQDLEELRRYVVARDREKATAQLRSMAAKY